ncbi:hypothetical protein GYB59_14450 [bacterium]|nr:hypothetical protein [bacterium]
MNTHPDCFYSKQMFAETFTVGKNRANDLANIVERDRDAMKNGHGVIAPLRVWMKALKTYNRRAKG